MSITSAFIVTMSCILVAFAVTALSASDVTGDGQINFTPYVIAQGSQSLSTEDFDRSGAQSQYQIQDYLGQYSYGYTEPLSSKRESRTLDGVTRGSYSYIDANNKLQTVEYLADSRGFHVSATNLPHANLEAPEPVTETPEVAAARAQHLAAHQRLTLRAQANPTDLGLEDTLATTNSGFLLPRPVEDTPEVAAAKVEFFRRFEQEKLRHQLLRMKQPSPAEITVYSSPLAVRIPSQTSVVASPIIPGLNFHSVLEKPKSTYLPQV